MTISYSAKKFVDTFIFDEALKLDKVGSTYSAFVLLSIGIEVLGHCLTKGKWGNSGGSEDTFMKALSEFSSLQKYLCFNYQVTITEKSCENKNCKWRCIHNLFHKPIHKVKTKNHLYSGVRCGLAHKMLNKNITLCHGSDNGKEFVIGFTDYYNNVHDAWIELQSPSFSNKLKKNLSEIIFYTDDATSSSGDTAYNVATYGNA